MSALVLIPALGCQGSESDIAGTEAEFHASSQQLDCGASQVPTLTSATAPGGSVTRSGVYSSSYEAWQAFDSNTSSMWISQVGQTPAWIGYEWLDAPRTITRYAITYSNGSITTRAPKDWTFEGWNGSAWVVLDTRTGQTSWLGTERREYAVTTPGAYSKYRLHFTDDNDTRTGIETISMGRLELFNCGECVVPTSQVPTLTSATPSGGSVTRSGVYSSSYEAWQAFDGNTSSMWISQVGQTPAWIGYEWLDAPRTITRYAITYSNGSITTRAPKDWTFEGWNGSAWVVIDTRTGQTSWLGTERREYAVTTPGAYSKYRVHITDDNDTRTAIETISMGRLEFLGCK
ncbi:discoidin domain-containing protein [Archangium violaceum]|uniref:discoidin domain-containing protein n=1 Tax=Archangium violaceum TaxID=83451 RepID=UPI002B2D09CB|nr:discoidin domain-containing protein [Archangium violaceum]